VASDVAAPAATGMSIAVHDRIHELEEALREERRALTELESRYRDLEQQYLELVGTRSTL
jgi:prefoldin subunit 5